MRFVVELPLEIGGQVWLIGQSDDSTYHEEDCGFCAGRGKITGANGEEDRCPKCYGAKKVNVKDHQQWIVKNCEDDEDDPFELFLYDLVVNKDKDKDGGLALKATLSLESEGLDQYENYDDEGGYFAVDTLFPSLDAAKAECERRNSLRS